MPKSKSNSAGAKDTVYPDIIEEPIRIVGKRTTVKSQKKPAASKSGKAVAKKSGKKR